MSFFSLPVFGEGGAEGAGWGPGDGWQFKGA